LHASRKFSYRRVSENRSSISSFKNKGAREKTSAEDDRTGTGGVVRLLLPDFRRRRFRRGVLVPPPRLPRALPQPAKGPAPAVRRVGRCQAVVTGPTSGIGRSVALELARRGLNLVLLDLDAANLQETSDVITSRHGVKRRTVVFDLSLVGTPQGVDRHIIFYLAMLVRVRRATGTGIGDRLPLIL